MLKSQVYFGSMGNKSSKGKISSKLETLQLVCDEKYENVSVEKATFGMQCFWDSDSIFGCTPGVVRTKSGFSGGSSKNPPVDGNVGDHIECVEIEFDPKKTTYINLLDIFWKNSDTTNPQITLYQSTIFYHSPVQKRKAEESLRENKILHGEVLTKILPIGQFYDAPSNQQKYRLQLDPFIMSKLKFDSTQLIRSHLATRLNGYICSNGSLELFEIEKAELGLSPELEEYIRALL